MDVTLAFPLPSGTVMYTRVGVGARVNWTWRLALV